MCQENTFAELACRDSVECLSHFLVMRSITISVLHPVCVRLAVSLFFYFMFLWSPFRFPSVSISHTCNPTAWLGNLFILVDWVMSVYRLVLTSLLITHTHIFSPMQTLVTLLHVYTHFLITHAVIIMSLAPLIVCSTGVFLKNVESTQRKRRQAHSPLELHENMHI